MYLLFLSLNSEKQFNSDWTGELTADVSDTKVKVIAAKMQLQCQNCHCFNKSRKYYHELLQPNFTIQVYSAVQKTMLMTLLEEPQSAQLIGVYV